MEELIGWDLFREEREGTLDLHYLLVKGGLEGRKCGRKGRRFFGYWLALREFYLVYLMNSIYERKTKLQYWGKSRDRWFELFFSFIMRVPIYRQLPQIPAAPQDHKVT